MKAEHSKTENTLINSKIKWILLIISIGLGIVLITILCLDLIYKFNSVNKDQATSIAYGVAMDECLATRPDLQDCVKMEHIDIHDISPGPTDGADEQNGSWSVTFSPMSGGLITIYLNHDGTVAEKLKQ